MDMYLAVPEEQEREAERMMMMGQEASGVQVQRSMVDQWRLPMLALVQAQDFLRIR
jgi:hypothetical protein